MAAETLSFNILARDLASPAFKDMAKSAGVASASLGNLSDQLSEVSGRVAKARVELDGDKEASAQLDKLGGQILRLSGRKVDPEVDLQGYLRTRAQITAIDVAMDRLDGKTATVEVKADVDRSFLSRLRGVFGGGGAGATGIAGGAAAAAGQGGQAGGGLLSALGPIGMGVALAAAAGGVATLLPALLPSLLGLGAGGVAAAGGVAVGAKDLAKLQALQKQLRGVTGTTASANARRAALQGQIAAFRQGHGPQLAFGQAAAGLLPAAEKTFFGALTARPVTLGPGGPVRGQSFLQGLIPIFQQIGRFTRSLQPMLGDLFRASLPYLKSFIGFMEQATKLLLPVFTSLLKQMTPYLPLISKGMMEIVKGFAGFLQALGPAGMQASAKIFVAFAIGAEYALKGLGIAINWLAEHVPVWVHNIAAWFDRLRHQLAAFGDYWRAIFDNVRNETAVIFDGIRHEIAHAWDQIFQNSVGMVIRLAHNVETQYNSLRHGIAVTFDGTRHDIAATWDTIWRNTVTRVQNGIADVVHFFRGLPGKVIGALQGLGTALYNFGNMMFTKFWNGMKAAWSFIASWVSRIAGWIKNLKGPIGKDMNLLYDEGRAIMHGLGRGIKHGFSSYVSRQLGDVGAGVQRWAGTVRAALAMEGLSPSLLGNVLYQIQTESGGNPNAINLTDINAQMGDPSRGLLQTIGSTFAAYHWPGTSGNIYDPLANIAAALNYARHVYGPSLMSGGMGIGSGHGYAAGSWNVPHTGAALIHQGEMVIPARTAAAIRGGAGGNTYNIHISALVADANAGRLAVEAIKQHERRNGAGWRN